MNKVQEVYDSKVVGFAMTPCPYVVKEFYTLQGALNIMEMNNISKLPVVNSENMVIGIVNYDTIVAVSGLSSNVGTYLDKSISILTTIDLVEDASRLFVENKISCIIVIHYETKEVVGILTKTDLIRYQRKINGE